MIITSSSEALNLIDIDAKLKIIGSYPATYIVSNTMSLLSSIEAAESAATHTETTRTGAVETVTANPTVISVATNRTVISITITIT